MRHWSITCLELELHTSVWWKAGRGPTQHVGVLGLNGRERRVVSAGKVQCRIFEAERGEVQLGAVLPRLTWPATKRWRRSWLEIQSQPRIRSSPTSISIGDTDIDSLHITVLLDTGATHCFICAQLAAALGLLPSDQPGLMSVTTAATGGTLELAALVPIHLCLGYTFRGPWAVSRKPDKRGMKAR